MARIKNKPKGITKEKRKSQRLNINLKVKYKLLPRKKILVETFSRDISGGGIRLKLPAPLEKGAKLKTFLYFSKTSRCVTALSEVIWCKRRQGKDRKVFDIGIKHIKIIPKDRERFVFLFCEMMINYFVLGGKLTLKPINV